LSEKQQKAQIIGGALIFHLS